jgi:hypothetical protein
VLPRRKATILVTTLVLATACGVGAALWQWKAPSYVRRRLERLTGHQVSVEGVALNHRLEIVAHNVRVFGAAPFQQQLLARADSVLVKLHGPEGFWSPSEVVVDGLDVQYLATPSGDNVRAGLDGSSRGPWPSRLKNPSQLPRIVVHDGRAHGTVAMPWGPQISFRLDGAEITREASGTVRATLRQATVDSRGWATVRAQAVEARLEQGGLYVSSPGQVSIAVPGGGTIEDGLSLRGSLSSTSAEVDLTNLEGATQQFRLWARIDRDAVNLAVDGQAIPLRALGALAFHRAIGLERATSTMHLALGLDRTSLLAEYRLDVSVTGVDYLHPALDTTPWRDQSAALHLQGQLDLAHRRLKLSDGSLSALAATLQMAGTIDLAPALRGQLTLTTAPDKPLSCAELWRGQPAPIRQALAGLALDGKVGLKVELAFDAADWEDLRLGVDVDPICAVKTEPQALAELLPDLRKPPKTEPGASRLPLGPATPDFVPLALMPRHLPSAFLTSEDSKFFHHHGFDVEMIRRALAQDLENRSFERGASTITQQLAKNLFLSHRRTLARKLEEAVLTWRLQKLLSKDRVLEIYLNIIELGPGIRGVKQAARKYFGKDVAELTPLESAHLAALTPNPHALARRFRDGTVDEGWQQRLYDLLGMMKRHGRLSPEELAKARASKLVLKDLRDDAALRPKQ